MTKNMMIQLLDIAYKKAMLSSLNLNYYKENNYESPYDVIAYAIGYDRERIRTIVSVYIHGNCSIHDELTSYGSNLLWDCTDILNRMSYESLRRGLEEI